MGPGRGIGTRLQMGSWQAEEGRPLGVGGLGIGEGTRISYLT